MRSGEIRDTFLSFFKEKNHEIVASAPMVVKGDSTLMFTNAGMNQFKDLFLGNSGIKYPRIANTQKCLRVSGKHNDLEEVGHDTYHHTMFEMLGNWSFGDYFKQEAIAWAWELLVDKLGIDKSRLYVTVFEGSKEDGVGLDEEAIKFWEQIIEKDRIILGSKKDNFWEMGDTGPCGPCSEIHVDIRSGEERAREDGKKLVNADHPEVIEIWNLVFIQYNRLSSGKLEPLAKKHIDTGMGFERLCMVLQEKKSNYDTDVFQPIIQQIAKISGKKYGENVQPDIAMRVVADHLRAVAFAIADGQLPSNNKAGYVIRRILRRAVRYAYSFLDMEEPFIFQLVDELANQMGKAFPGLNAQKELVTKVIKEEEASFSRTLGKGIAMFENYIQHGEKGMKKKGLSAKEQEQYNQKVISGDFAFELYDTYGFPVDLTQLMAKENGWNIDLGRYQECLNEQKTRSQKDSAVDTGDWHVIDSQKEVVFTGYDELESIATINRYRKVSAKGKELFQIVFSRTPFYAEGGGQVGDTGYFEKDGKKYSIVDTLNENNLVIHLAKDFPEDPSGEIKLVVNDNKRLATARNHSATHLMHFALRKVLGDHVEQKGSLVNAVNLRFDFSHFQKLTSEEIKQVESLVNKMILQNLPVEENREMAMEEAREMGAMALFGEKYGEKVRVVKFGDSVELCGGTHVMFTGQIGLFKIITESSISAGVRRIEAITGEKAFAHVDEKMALLEEISNTLGNPKDISKAVNALVEENKAQGKKLEEFKKAETKQVKNDLKTKVEKIGGINLIAAKIGLDSQDAVKDLAFQIKNEIDDLYLALATDINGKPGLTLMISESLVKEKNLNAGNIIREAAREIKGGGGGQAFFATAGGKNPAGIEKALSKMKEAAIQ